MDLDCKPRLLLSPESSIGKPVSQTMNDIDPSQVLHNLDPKRTLPKIEVTLMRTGSSKQQPAGGESEQHKKQKSTSKKRPMSNINTLTDCHLIFETKLKIVNILQVGNGDLLQTFFASVWVNQFKEENFPLNSTQLNSSPLLFIFLLSSIPFIINSQVLAAFSQVFISTVCSGQDE